MINLEVDETQLDRIASAIGATPKEISRAFNITVVETARPLRRQGLRRMQAQLGLRNQKALGKRFKISVRRGESGRRLWIGLNDLPVGAFVPPGQARSQQRRRAYATVRPHTRSSGDVRGFRRRYQAGVTAGGRRFPHGFWADRNGPPEALHRPTNRARQAVAPLKIPIHQEGRQVAEELFAALPDTFYPRFAHNVERMVLTRNG